VSKSVFRQNRHYDTRSYANLFYGLAILCDGTRHARFGMDKMVRTKRGNSRVARSSTRNRLKKNSSQENHFNPGTHSSLVFWKHCLSRLPLPPGALQVSGGCAPPLGVADHPKLEEKEKIMFACGVECQAKGRGNVEISTRVD
jgi:hypothetical protein